MHPFRLTCPVLATALAIALAACNGPQAAAGAPETPAATAAAATSQPSTPNSPPSATSTQGTVPMGTIDSFVPAGSKALETIRGDLTGAGRSDALLVVSPPSTGTEKLGEGTPRTVMLLTQQADGAFQKAAENSKIVPCARCGGLAGDPYAFSRIQPGQFTISISGGSRERWADDFTFKYSADKRTWLLDKVVRDLSDTETEQHNTLELTTNDFGMVAFQEFDPATLKKTAALDEAAGEKTN
ncbi:glucose/arabinose dehydrogenase [Xanthomonas arboricola]|nr:glucose/arabinose dehydrogenase [Xanthomonas cannabis]